jgi:aminoglycoside phosphotransferase (APT) family kinase protein
VDPQAILFALGVQAEARISAVSGGWDTRLWRVETAAGTYALRVFRPEQAQTAVREAIVMRNMPPRVPVPKVCAQGTWHDRPALLLSWCSGRTILAEAAARPWLAWQLGTTMGRTHARIHAAPIAHEVDQVLPRRTDIGSTAQPSILHLDYHPLNVMTDGRGITGVLDWANAAIGDRRADLARTVTIMRLAPLPPGGPVRVLAVLRAVLERAWRSGYRREQGSDPFVGLEPFYAWAGALMERDLRGKLGRPGVWLREADLARIRRWTSRYERR